MRALGLLLILTALALVALGLLHSFAGNCTRIEREAKGSIAAMELCSRTVGCQLNYRDLVAVAQQRRASKQCALRENVR